MDSENAIKKITTGSKNPIPECNNRHSREEFEHPGIYALFLKKNKQFYPTLVLDNRRLLYVGIATNAYDRFFNQHVCKHNSSLSTLRRTIGAMLHPELQLKAIPRDGKPEKKCYHYRFVENDEKKLSSWMQDNLEWIFCKIDNKDLKEIQVTEKNIVKKLKPPLNIQYSKHEFKETILKLRKDCREEAEKNHH